jgi:hypothetical protein
VFVFFASSLFYDALTATKIKLRRMNFKGFGWNGSLPNFKVLSYVRLQGQENHGILSQDWMVPCLDLNPVPSEEDRGVLTNGPRHTVC